MFSYCLSLAPKKSEQLLNSLNAYNPKPQSRQANNSIQTTPSKFKVKQYHNFQPIEDQDIKIEMSQRWKFDNSPAAKNRGISHYNRIDENLGESAYFRGKKDNFNKRNNGRSQSKVGWQLAQSVIDQKSSQKVFDLPQIRTKNSKNSVMLKDSASVTGDKNQLRKVMNSHNQISLFNFEKQSKYSFNKYDDHDQHTNGKMSEILGFDKDSHYNKIVSGQIYKNAVVNKNLKNQLNMQKKMSKNATAANFDSSKQKLPLSTKQYVNNFELIKNNSLTTQNTSITMPSKLAETQNVLGVRKQPSKNGPAIIIYNNKNQSEQLNQSFLMAESTETLPTQKILQKNLILDNAITNYNLSNNKLNFSQTPIKMNEKIQTSSFNLNSQSKKSVLIQNQNLKQDPFLVGQINQIDSKTQKANYSLQSSPRLPDGQLQNNLSKQMRQINYQAPPRIRNYQSVKPGDNEIFKVQREKELNQDIDMLQNLESNLKQSFIGKENHHYIDKILSNSPNWNNLKNLQNLKNFAARNNPYVNQSQSHGSNLMNNKQQSEFQNNKSIVNLLEDQAPSDQKSTKRFSMLNNINPGESQKELAKDLDQSIIVRNQTISNRGDFVDRNGQDLNNKNQFLVSTQNQIREESNSQSNMKTQSDIKQSQLKQQALFNNIVDDNNMMKQVSTEEGTIQSKVTPTIEDSYQQNILHLQNQISLTQLRRSTLNTQSESRFNTKSQLEQNRGTMMNKSQITFDSGKRCQEIYIPGVSKAEMPQSLKQILNESSKLRNFSTKMWLKKRLKVKHIQAEPENNEGEKQNEMEKEVQNQKQKDLIKRLQKKRDVNVKYLMSDQEIKQDVIIEKIFKKFDIDGSGSLDTSELQDLFHQNKIFIDRDTVKAMFGSEEFTLQKFKSIINSEEDLQRFKGILESQREKMKLEFNKKEAQKYKMDNLMYKMKQRGHLKQSDSDKSPDFRSKDLKDRVKIDHFTLENQNSFDAMDSFTEAEQDDRLVYLPQTFEGMMECFGVNLQRMNLYQQFNDKVNYISKMCKKKEASPLIIIDQVNEVCENMTKIMQVSIADSSNLRNQHNQLFLGLMDKLERLKKEEVDKYRRKTMMMLDTQKNHLHEQLRDQFIKRERQSLILSESLINQITQNFQNGLGKEELNQIQQLISNEQKNE